MKMIISSDCEVCQNGILEEENDKPLKVYCCKRDKSYYFGQCIPCDDFISKTHKRKD